MRQLIIIISMILCVSTLSYSLSYEEKQLKIMQRYTEQLRSEYGWTTSDITELTQHLTATYHYMNQRIEAMRHVMLCAKYHEKSEWKMEEKSKFQNTEKLVQKIQERKKEMKQLKSNMSGNGNSNRDKGEGQGNGQGQGK